MFGLFGKKPPAGIPKEARFNKQIQEWEIHPKVEGEYRSWREDGTLACVAHYEAGELHGEWKRYHPNGEIARERQMEAGETVGVEKWHRSNEETPENSNMQDDTYFPYFVWTVALDHETDEPSYFDEEGKEVKQP